MAGELDGTVDFGGGPISKVGDPDALLVKLDVTGEHLASERFGDAGWQNFNDVAVDGAGDVFVIGNFHGSIDLGTGPLTSADYFDVFLAKLTP